MWKEIKDFEGYYDVSDNGEVRSRDRYVVNQSGKSRGAKRFLKGKLMKQTESVSKQRGGQGYLVVNLRKECTSTVRQVHILVANAFIPNPLNLPTVNHKDGDKHNNRVENLEWSSYSENNVHALKNGLRHPRGNAIGMYKDGVLVNTFRSACDAARITGLSRGGISHCLNGRTNQSGGFVWKKLSQSATTIPSGSTQEDELPAEAQRPSQMEDIVYTVSNNGNL